ncbi:GNAT family N-acetyltransferase [Paenibacillus graminis]|uniref:GNAT family N-acetyltransferase n=1 Tax=Paenibacillus graminis TaxID=189425 RepID=UPI002DBB293B|nr:GNAT family N-acetyltransferase [Paenibacillus graminis]MEC0168321.1 GNAT family N-acetyltransferase [Paenibacillus graminis]
MSTNVIPLLYHSKEQIADITRLEQDCSQSDSFYINAGIEHLAKADGDHGILCYQDNHIIGLLSWYTSDGRIANINALVHPGHRRQGVFRSLLQRAAEDMKPQGIEVLCFRFPQGSQAGLAAAQSLGAVFNRSEYLMALNPMIVNSPVSMDLSLFPAGPEDFEFMVACSSAAFGDSEAWTRRYFTQTNKPGRVTYIAWMNNYRVGLIRFNSLNDVTIIHDFCILPSHQGKGLGQNVLILALELLSQKPHPHIRLSVVTDNERALSLYRNAGFEVKVQHQYYMSSL